MKKIKIFVLSFILVAFVFASYIPDKTFSRYTKNGSVNITTTSANMICDATIDNPGTYISNDGWAYFKVIVKNYNTSGTVTQIPIQYNLTVSNRSGSNAVYRYLDASGNTNNFESTFTTRNYKFTTGTQQSQSINVEVKTDSMTSENVDFKVDLNCFQVQK